MTYLAFIPAYILGFLTYRVWTIFHKELNRGQGGEILRITRLKKT